MTDGVQLFQFEVRGIDQQYPFELSGGQMPALNDCPDLPAEAKILGWRMNRLDDRCCSRADHPGYADANCVRKPG